MEEGKLVQKKSAAAGMKILVVEDNEDSRILLTKQLRAYGHEVMAAADGVEALEQALAQPPDIIVSDIMMPEMDGFQLCHECKQNEQLKNVPFVFYTATYTLDEDKKFALSLRADAFILKPTEPDVLVQKLCEIFQKSKSRALAPAEVAPREPSLFFAEHDKRIFAKLEDKVTQLEAEITKRRQAEAEVKHLNRVLRTIRNVNQLIVREKEQDKLLKSACVTLIKNRDYESAYICLFDESGMLVTHGEAGLSKDFMPMVERLKRGELPDCIKRTLIQSGVVVTKTSSLACGDCPIVKMCSGKKVVTIRLEYDGKVYGLLKLQLSGDASVSEEEQSLLQEVTGDIAFALHDMELEEERKRLERDLGERVKELQCLYGIASIAEISGITLDELYQEVVNILPPGWQYPEITCANITIYGKEFKTENCRDRGTKWKQTSDIKVHGAKAGTVHVGYLEARPELDEGPFLKEERQLIDAVAERLGLITERKRAEEALYRQIAFVRLLEEAAIIANQALSVEDALQLTLDLVCAHKGWPVGHVYLLAGDSTDELAPTTIWHLERAEKFETFRKVTEVTFSTSGVGLPGRVLATGKPAWIVDVTKDPNFPRAKLAKEIGVKAGFAFPVLSGTEMVAVLEFFSAEAEEPDDALLELMSHIGTQLGRVVERKQAEEALRHAAEEWRTTFDSITDLVSICDKDFKLIRVNKVFADAFKMKPMELIGKHCYEMLHGTNELMPNCPYKQTLKDGKPHMAEYFEPHLGIHLEETISPIFDEKGQVTACVQVARDITERKREEEELRKHREHLEEMVKERTGQLEKAAQAVEVASRAKSDFLASMSHELRTPLNAVIGFSQVLQEQYFGDLNEKQAEYISDILGSGQHLLALINDILDLSKIEAGKMELELSKVIIKDLLGSSLIMIKEKALVHGISLDIDTTGDLEYLRIMVDERKVKQVMFNLLSNAAKFTPDGGTIRVEGKKEGKELIISVSDTGTGIASEEQERIFEEFYQTSGKMKNKTPGTGLGLPITRRIVEMHGGRIWVESEGLDKGSRFTFTLPI